MIYITGDTHREIDIWKINPDDGFPKGKELTDKDYVLICGDFGCIWDGAQGDAFWLKWLESLPWTTLFVDGNHENFDVLNNYPIMEWHGGLVHRIRYNVLHLMRGQVFEIEGKNFFTFGGAFSHDRVMRTEHKNWWQDEMPIKEEIERAHINLNKVNWKVDYVISHDVYSNHSLSKKYEASMGYYDKKYFNVQKVLEEIRNKLNYEIWFTGHYHIDYVEMTDNKPCVTLFNFVLNLNDIENEIKEHFE